MLVNRFDFDMQQWATFQLVLNIQDANTNPINLSGYNSVLTIKTDYSNSSVVDSLSTANGEIQVVNSGSYLLMLPPTRTGAIPVDTIDNPIAVPPKTNYVYDMILTDTQGISTKIIYGNISVYASVSV